MLILSTAPQPTRTNPADRRHLQHNDERWSKANQLPGDMTMLERVDMDVIHMAAVILLIPDQMFPIMALPDATFPVP